MKQLLSGLCAALLLTSPGVAQETKPSLLLELNGAQPSDKGCRLTFVVVNNLEGRARKLGAEVVDHHESQAAALV